MIMDSADVKQELAEADLKNPNNVEVKKALSVRWLNFYPFKNPNFFSLNGRINRAKYILTMLVVILICTPVEMVWPNVGYLLVSLGLFFAGIKRCHDLNWSGGGLIIMACLPFLGLVLLFKKGTAGSNRYGPDPLSLE